MNRIKPFHNTGKPDRGSRLILLLWIAISLPLLFLGYGSDYDAWRVAQTAESLWQTGIYTPSRSLGFPLYELAVTPLVAAGSGMAAESPIFFSGRIAGDAWRACTPWLFSNALALAAALLIYLALQRLANSGHFRHPRLVLLTVLFFPLFFKNATVTMDYLPALALLIWAYLRLQESRWDEAALLIGLSVGFRPTAILFMLPAACLIYLTTRDKSRLLRGLAVCAAFALLAYSPMLFAENFGAPSPAPRSGITQHIALVAFHGLRFLGLAQTILLAVMIGLTWRQRARIRAPKPLAVFHYLNLAVWCALFLLLPDEPDYLLPALLSLVFIMDRLFSRSLFTAATIIMLSYHVVQLEVRTDAPDTLQLRPHLAAGYTIEDIQDRIFKLSLRDAANRFVPERPTLLMFGLPWIPAVNDRWIYETETGLYRQKEGRFYLAGRITERERITALKMRGIRLVAWRTAVWDYLRTGSTAWQGEVEILGDVRTLFPDPVRGKALNER